MTASPLIGPVRSFAAYCTDHAAPASAEELGEPRCDPGATPDGVPLRAPFVGATLVTVDAPDADERHLHLAVALANGVYGQRIGEEFPGYQEFEVLEMKVVHSRLLVHIRETMAERDWVDDEETMRGFVEVQRDEHLTICGRGASGGVSCLPPVSLETWDQRANQRTYAVEARLLGPERLLLRDRMKGASSRAAGIHRLVFP